MYGWYAALIATSLLPLYFVAISSVTPSTDLLSAPATWFPDQLTFGNYRELADQLDLAQMALTSLTFAIGTAAATIVVALPAAYVFARYEFPAKEVLFALVLLSAALPQVATIIPLFELLGDLGLVNSTLGLIVVMSSFLAPFTVWILRSFVQAIPHELDEAARLDGAGDLRILWKIILPLTVPAIVTMFLINFVITWNELFFPLVLASGTDSQTLSLGLVNLSFATAGVGRPWHLISALSVVMIVPIAVVVLVFQRRIVSGLTTGATK